MLLEIKTALADAQAEVTGPHYRVLLTQKQIDFLLKLLDIDESIEFADKDHADD
jgi:hypothetical protein